MESRSTGARPADRLVTERRFLSPLPAERFDTDYVATRRVHNILPFVTIDGARYSVPPKVLGQLMEVRRPVGSQRLELRWAGQLVAAHTVAHRRRIDVWDPEHRRQAEAAATAGRPRRPVLRLVASSPEPARVDVGGGFDVDPVDLARRYPVTLRDSRAQR